MAARLLCPGYEQEPPSRVFNRNPRNHPTRPLALMKARGKASVAPHLTKPVDCDAVAHRHCGLLRPGQRSHQSQQCPHRGTGATHATTDSSSSTASSSCAYQYYEFEPFCFKQGCERPNIIECRPFAVLRSSVLVGPPPPVFVAPPPWMLTSWPPSRPR